MTGEDLLIDLPNEMVDSLGTQAKIKADVRARHETVNGRFKEWGMFSRPYRHIPSSHASVFRAIVVITQISMSLDRSTLFNVDYTTLSLNSLNLL